MRGFWAETNGDTFVTYELDDAVLIHGAICRAVFERPYTYQDLTSSDIALLKLLQQLWYRELRDLTGARRHALCNEINHAPLLRPAPDLVGSQPPFLGNQRQNMLAFGLRGLFPGHVV